MTIAQRQGTRRRRTPDETRLLALDAAQALLAAEGPQGITLQAVAAAIGMTHGNLTHHFGSSGGLQAALILRMGERLSRDVAVAALRLRSGEATPREIVDLVFDSLARDDHGRLIAWLSSTGQVDRLAPVFEAVAKAVRDLRAGEPAGVDAARQGAGPMAVVLLGGALSASLIGGPLQAAAGLGDDALRDLTARQLVSLRA